MSPAILKASLITPARFLSSVLNFEQIQKLDEANLLYQVVCRFAEVDLHPEVVSNHVMGSIFEELIRRFSEQSNETAGSILRRARSSV